MEKKVNEILGTQRMLCGSKGQYRHDNPRNIVIFNSNICIAKTKVWYGDFDVTVDEVKLFELAKALKETVHLLYESDGRFDNEESPKIEKAVVSMTSDGVLLIGEKYEKYFERVDGRLVRTEIKKEEKELPDHSNSSCGDKEYCIDDYVRIIQLPDVKEFKSRKKSVDPYDKFYSFLKDKLGLSADMVIDPSTVVISTDYLKQLETAVESWAKCGHRLSGYQLKKAVMWHNFGFAPSQFFNSKFGPTWAEKDCAYIKADYVVLKKEEL